MRKNVFIIHPMDSYFPVQGGGIRYLMNVLLAFKKRSWEITVIGIKEVSSSKNQDWKQISISKANKGWVVYLIKLWLIAPFIKIPKGSVLIAHRLDCLVPFTIWHPNCKHILISAAPMYYLKLKTGSYFKYLKIIYKYFENICVKKLHLLIPVDQLTENYYLKNYPFIKERILRLPSPINFSDFPFIDINEAKTILSLDHRLDYILFLGRLAPVKNIPFIISAFLKALIDNPNLNLLVVGDGEDKKVLIEEFVNTETKKNINFVGKIDPEKVYLYLNAASLLVLASVEEGSPTVVKEALACGTQVLSTDVGDVKEVLNYGEFCGRVTENSINDFAEAMITMTMINGDTSQRIKRRKVALNYSYENIFNDYLFQKL